MAELNNNKINENDLDGVSGGAVFYAGGISGSNPNAQYEVINDTDRIVNGKGKGEVLGQFSSMNEAIAAAQRDNISTMEIGWNAVQGLRGN